MKTILKVPPGAKITETTEGNLRVYRVAGTDDKILGLIRTDASDVTILEDPYTTTVGWDVLPRDGHCIEITRNTFRID